MSVQMIISVARDLTSWFSECIEAHKKLSDAISPEKEHQVLTLRGTLARQTKQLFRSLEDESGEANIFMPTMWILASACQILDFKPNTMHWAQAVKNVYELQPQLDSAQPYVFWELSSASHVFFDQLSTALENAGFTSKPSPLSEKNRAVALGHSIHWGLRFLTAHALEKTPPENPPPALAKLYEILQPLRKDLVG